MATFLRFTLLYPLCLLLLAAGLFTLWLGTRDVSSLPPPVHDMKVLNSRAATVGGRHLEHFTLDGGPLGEIGIFVNLPDPLPKEKIPVLLVLGGLGTGESNIRMITGAGNNAVISYDWPLPVPVPEGKELIKALPSLYRQAMLVPGQGASAIAWLSSQPWADSKRISVLGFSLGALAAPSIENLAQADGHPAGWTIIAYGGAPLGALFAANPHMKPDWLRPVLGPMIDIVLHPLQPTVNLPQLKGRFLVLEGENDALIPREARETLRNAVPPSRDVIVFSGDHMGVGQDKQALLEQIISTSRRWIVDSGAGNPPAQEK